MAGKKSYILAYIFWLFGGFFGLHLFYLGRDRHAFICWCSLGEGGFGWLFHFFKIPRYVRRANDDPRSVERFVKRLQEHKKPPFSTSRFVSAVMVAYLWGQLVMMATPEDEFHGINWKFFHWLVPFAIGLGVWTVGNIGRERGKPWAAIGIAYVTYLSRYFFFDESIWLTGTVFCSAITFESFSKEWDRSHPKRRSFTRRVLTLTLCGILYLSLWGAYFYFNGKVTDSNGDEIPVHEAIHHFFTSPWWTDLKQSLYDTYQYAQHHGWYEVWKQIVDLSDPHGEQNAYKVLNLSPTATQSEITSKWRQLSREWHPDKVKDPALRSAAQEKFMEIQQAYEILSKIKTKRKRRNKQSV